ncbi:MAG: hypothetical protein ABEJ99_00030 [Candidatus Nanohaloarchaea archaeon]
MSLDKEIILEGEIKEIAGYSGKKERCPECGRETDDGFCAVHAQVDPEKDFSLTVKIEGKKVNLNESHFEEITGFSVQEIEALPENEKISLLKEKMKGIKLRATGSNGKDRFYPNEVDVISE